LTLAWARVDPASGDEAHQHGEGLVPAASTIEIFVASAFWRSGLDPDEPHGARLWTAGLHDR
jgi:hypothetical protein